jgi:SHAQKYF class myb-like DNA-binding protein
MIEEDDFASKESGKWTKEEHEKFLVGLRDYGDKWKLVQQIVQTRSCSQVRSHAQKFFIKMKKFDLDK